MSTSTSLQQFATSYTSFSTASSGPQSNRIAQTQTSRLDNLAEEPQYALEQLQLSSDTGVTSAALSGSVVKSKEQLYMGNQTGFKTSSQRDILTDSRAGIRKNSSSAPIRRRISRACDQCNQLRTKCDGQNPCAHCIGNPLDMLTRVSSSADVP